jgi:hypothetical protein
MEKIDRLLNPNLLIHIGYPKTASTWLQNCIFNGQNSPFFCLPADEGIQQFVLANEFCFCAEGARKSFYLYLEEAANQSRIPVLSNEILTGDQIKERYWGKIVADRLFSTFLKAKILVIIREQKSMILSSYREHIMQGGTENLERFIGTGHEKPGFGSICRLDFLEYDLLISYYQKLFGSENLLVLPFELLKDNRQAFIQQIFNFVGIEKIKNYSEQPQNIGYNALTIEFRRRVNFLVEPAYFGNNSPPVTWRMAQKLSRVVERVIPSKAHESLEKQLKQFIKERTKQTFDRSNQRTSQLIGIDLAKLGYDL